MKKVRCAIYTRKSSEDGLEQDFNSLHAQREACEAYIASQKAEGWVLLADQYDDGGISGGTLKRPSLHKLLADVDAGKVDQIVVYKIDRLTRSLTDFAKLVERLDNAKASFVSVTQSFNTATSMGRLTLNVLLSFAQFEREVTAERIRDKILASKQKGLWMGGQIPIGYDADGRTLKIHKPEAETIITLFDLYLEHGTVQKVKTHADRLGLVSKNRINKTGKTSGGTSLNRGHIYSILSNPLYAGKIRHKKRIYDGKHPAIIGDDIWQKVQKNLISNAARQRGKANRVKHSPFAGKLFDETGDRLTASHTKKNGIRHRYYISNRLIKNSGDNKQDGWRLPATQLEQSIAQILTQFLSDIGKVTKSISDLTTNEAANLHDNLAVINTELSGPEGTHKAAMVVHRINLQQGTLTIELDRKAFAKQLQINRERISADLLTIRSPFQLRKRGVETKLVLGNPSAELDQTLIRYVAKAHSWYEAIKQGSSFENIAVKEGVSAQRIRQLIGIAFLAPDIVKQILEGKQSIALTSEWLQRNNIPSCWEHQRRLIANL